MPDGKSKERKEQEQKLLAGCLRNEERSYSKFYNLFKAKMYGMCLRYAQSDVEAQEFLQEGFIEVFKSLKNYNNTGSLEGWVRKVILNVSLQHIRKNMKTPKALPLQEEIYQSDLDNDVSDDHFIDKKKVLRCIQQLPEGYRTVLNLYAIEGWSHKQIAESLSISIGTSKSQLNRARANLKKELKTNSVMYNEG